MEQLREQGELRDQDRWNLLREQLDLAYKQEDAYWSQKSRVQWLKEGDKNTQFFHASTIQRRKRNRIEEIEKERGGWCNTDEAIVYEISDYYFKLFTSEDSRDWEDKLNWIPPTITESMNSNLIKPVNEWEIKAALFSMNPNKAPGMDGMTSLFFQTFWHIVQNGICKAVKSFLYLVSC